MFPAGKADCTCKVGNEQVNSRKVNRPSESSISSDTARQSIFDSVLVIFDLVAVESFEIDPKGRSPGALLYLLVERITGVDMQF